MKHRARPTRTLVAMSLLGGLIAGSPGAEAAKLFVASTDQKVLRYSLEEGGAATRDDFVLSVPVPISMAFGPGGELFVTSSRDGASSVYRFLKPGESSPFNGQILDGNLNAPHWAAFRPGGELFIAQRDGSNVVRFRVAPSGAASFVGAISQNMPPRAPRGLVFAPWGELFVSQCCGFDRIDRYLFDGEGRALANGSVTGNGLRNPHGMAFSNRGELFVANADGNSISRFLFDSNRGAQANGQLQGNGLAAPLGLAFSPWGELFVANANSASLARWTFDGAWNASPRPAVALPATARDVVFLPADTTSNAVLGSLTGVTLQSVSCENQTLALKVAVQTPSLPLDCKAAGLPIRPGDAIEIRATGTVR